MTHTVLMPFRLPLDGFLDLPSDFELLVPNVEFSFEASLSDYLPICDAIVSVFGQSINREMIDQALKLRIIANYGVGYDNIDVKYATKNGIVVTNTPDPVTEPTAELAMALMVGLARNIVGLHNGVTNGSITDWGVLNNLSTTLVGKKLGIVGMGAIGQSVARRALASGMKIYYHNRNKLSSNIEEKYNAKYLSLDNLLRESDFVSLNVPLTPETFHLMGKDEFTKMKSSAFLINTSRGKVVDEKLLIKALRNREIAGAGLDVYRNEPFVPDELKKMPNVILTPHTGTATYEARADMSKYVSGVVQKFFQGNMDIPIINPEVFDSNAFNLKIGT